jgi:alkylation response protein AidB-like acyl-CoA dehydrogenase
MDLSLSEAERDLVGLCREFAQKEIAVRAPAAWEEGRCPTDLLREMGALGLLGMLIPEDWGGIGMSTVGFVAAMEQIGQADQSVAAAWQAHVTIGSLPLYLFGTDAQRERWLRPLAEGRALGAFGLTEPDAGSDARGIRTKAERRDGGWLINGRKTFISNAGTDMSFGVTLLARTEANYATFVVEKDTPGFTMGPKMRGIGWRGLDTRELYLDDVWVRDEHLVGDPDLGLNQFLRTLEVGRISIAALSAEPHPGRARPGHGLRPPAGPVRPAHLQVPGRAVQAGRHRHRAGGGPLAHLPGRVLARRGPAVPEGGGDGQAQGQPGWPAWAASEAVQIHGGIGYMLESPGGPVLLRLEGARDRRGHQRDPAPRHRPRWAADQRSHAHKAAEAAAMSSRSESHARCSPGRRRGRGRRRWVDGGVEVPERSRARPPGRNLGADARREMTRLVGRSADGPFGPPTPDLGRVQGGHRTEVDHLAEMPFPSATAFGCGQRLVDHARDRDTVASVPGAAPRPTHRSARCGRRGLGALHAVEAAGSR